MISVLIPLLAYMPYKEQIKTTIAGLSRQTADLEIIVSEQPIVGKYDRICKGKLHNEGFAKSTGDIIFHCDADIIFNDETMLERMEAKLYGEDLDVIYPMFPSPRFGHLKLADGHPFMRREVRKEYGPIDETLMGVSLQEFHILHWLYFNKRFHCSPEFVFELNTEPFVKIAHKLDKSTKARSFNIMKEVVAELEKEGVWQTRPVLSVGVEAERPVSDTARQTSTSGGLD